jgi:heat shock protein HslJ
MKNGFYSFCFFIFVGLFFSACSFNQAPMEQHMKLTQNHWELEAISGENRSILDGLKAPFIYFEDDSKVHGFDGCNLFFGNYEVSGNELNFSQLAATDMYCQDSMQVADKFTNQLVQSKEFQIENSKLILLNSSKSPLLQFSLNPNPKE